MPEECRWGTDWFFYGRAEIREDPVVASILRVPAHIVQALGCRLPEPDREAQKCFVKQVTALLGDEVGDGVRIAGFGGDIVSGIDLLHVYLPVSDASGGWHDASAVQPEVGVTVPNSH